MGSVDQDICLYLHSTVHLTMPLYYLLLVTAFLLMPAVTAQDQDECKRHCPEDLHASVFTNRLRDRVEFIQRSLTAAVDGLELLQAKTSNIPEIMKEKMGQMGGKLEETNEDAGEGIKRLKMLLADLIEHLLRADRRAWNRIIDTHLDILDKSRAPQAPKDLPDLRIEIENLDKTVKESEESFEPLLKELGGSLGRVFSSLVLVVESMLKAGGEEMVLEKMKEKVDNMLGKVLVKLVENKTKNIQTAQPRILGDVAKLTEKFSYDFYALGLKVKLGEFWKMELKTLEDYLAHVTVPGDDADEDVRLIVSIIEKYSE